MINGGNVSGKPTGSIGFIYLPAFAVIVLASASEKPWLKGRHR